MPRRPPPPPHALKSLSPLRILTQIITLQLLYYLCTTTLLLFTALTAGKPFTPDLVLSWRSLRGDTTVGWTLGLCWMGGSFCGYLYTLTNNFQGRTLIPKAPVQSVILLLFLIARSKLVPDFALSLHAIHLIVTSLYTRSLPTNTLWWALMTVSATLMTVGGVWSCRWRELRPISFGGGGAKGGGEYEMVPTAENGSVGEGRA